MQLKMKDRQDERRGCWLVAASVRGGSALAGCACVSRGVATMRHISPFGCVVRCNMIGLRRVFQIVLSCCFQSQLIVPLSDDSANLWI